MIKNRKIINYIIPVPFLFNFLLNLLDNQFTINHLNKNSFILSFVCFIFLVNTGKLISKYIPNQFTYTIDVRELTSGIYHAEIKTPNNTKIEKFVKN